MGDVHTNTIEGIWSLLKDGICGAHRAVGAGHFQNYVNEYVFRYNHRDDVQPMFRSITDRVSEVRNGPVRRVRPDWRLANALQRFAQAGEALHDAFHCDGVSRARQPPVLQLQLDHLQRDSNPLERTGLGRPGYHRRALTTR